MKLLQVTLLMPRILMSFLRFWKICGLLNKRINTNLKEIETSRLMWDGIIKLC
jgi:hypothetical protein